MKRLFKFAVLSLAVATFWACDSDKEYVDPGMEVTPNSISGTWYLAEWNGSPLADGSFVYMELTRKDKEFTIYQNLDSFGTRKLTGIYNIYVDEALGSVIRGQYNYGNGDWAHRYIIRDLSEDSMTWIAKDDMSDISVYKRCDKIPDDVVNGKFINE